MSTQRSQPRDIASDWLPRRRGRIYCSPACGFDCTFATYERALRDSAALARRLGPGWKPDVWENGTWHWAVRSPCRRWKVSPTLHGGWIAFLGSADCPGGRWHGTGRSPRAAMRHAWEQFEKKLEEVRSFEDARPTARGLA